MGNILICLTIAILSFHFFSVTYCLNGINRTVYNMPISAFESSIPLVQEIDKPVIYFDKDDLENKITYYLENALKRFTNSFDCKYYYYNQGDKSLCTSDYCDAVEITVTCKVLAIYDYQKSFNYYIRSNK